MKWETVGWEGVVGGHPVDPVNPVCGAENPHRTTQIHGSFVEGIRIEESDPHLPSFRRLSEHLLCDSQIFEFPMLCYVFHPTIPLRVKVCLPR